MTELIGIGNTLKKIYRAYSLDVLNELNKLGHESLTYSYIEVISFICENEGVSLKVIGKSLGLKKQTMTNHIAELEKRGVIFRQQCESDRRAQLVYLTETGEALKRNLFAIISKIEKDYGEIIGGIELERLQGSLEKFHQRLERRNELF